MPLLFACQAETSSENKNEKEETGRSYQELLTSGRDASAKTQAVLLANIGKALKEGGTVHAVAFCNVNAMPLVDSISTETGMHVSRISTRNRNENNVVKTHEDKVAWSYFASRGRNTAITDTVLFDKAKHPTYYKPIRIGMETCLKCHGSRSTEIDLPTLEKLDELYPTDRAVNYLMGDLRGLWKVEF